MAVEYGLTNEFCNTQYAPLAALLVYYEAEQVLLPLQSLSFADDRGEWCLAEKLVQVLVSIFAGCVYISEVNTKLRPERALAQVKRIDAFAEQSTVARALTGLTQMNLAQIEAAVQTISRACSQIEHHDWRGFLVLDFDLTGLPCGKGAEGSRKGHFSGKKTSLDAN